MKTKRITSTDVARLAQVSHALVSLAINNPQKVRPETRERIRQAISQLGYKPFQYARAMAKQQHEAIGLVMDVKERKPLYDGSRLLLAQGIAEVLTEANNMLGLATLNRDHFMEQIKTLPLLTSQRIDGVILNAETQFDDLSLLLSSFGIPYVLVNCTLRLENDCVYPNDFECAYQSVHYLIGRGHRRIRYFSGSVGGHKPSIEVRERGYELAMFRSQLQPLPGYDRRFPAAHRSTDPEFVQALEEELTQALEQGATALLTYNGGLANRLLEICYRRGINIPNDVSLMSCDDDGSLSGGCCPVTSMSTDRYEQGVLSAQMILKKVNDPKLKIPSVIVKPQLFERKSVKLLG